MKINCKQFNSEIMSSHTKIINTHTKLNDSFGMFEYSMAKLGVNFPQTESS